MPIELINFLIIIIYVVLLLVDVGIINNNSVYKKMLGR